MRLSSIILALVGLGVAGGSAQMAREMLMTSSATAAVEQSDTMVNVIVASRAIRRGDAIDGSMLRNQPWPRDAVPEGAFLQPSALLPSQGGEPRRATRPMIAGEVVLPGNVSEFGARVSLLQTLSPDTRAMAIRVDAVTAVGGFVTPGDHIDLLLTRTDGQQLVTDTILRNLRVLAVDQSSDDRADRPAVATTVTVEVTSEQGQILALAQRAGTLSLALRNPDAVDTGGIDRLRLRDLLPELVAAPVAAPDLAAPDPAPAPAAPAPEPAPAPVVVAAPPPPPVAPARSSILVRRAATSIEEVSVRTSDTDTGDTDAEDDADKTEDATDDETDETELVQ